MLSPIIRNLIEKKLTHEIRYSSDIECLAIDIEKCTKKRLGINTLKRMFGMIDETASPRLYTLDVIAEYLNFKNWDHLLTSLENEGNSDFSANDEIDSKDLCVGAKISFTYSPDRSVTLMFEGNNLYKVTESVNSKLQIDDIVEARHFVLNYPLIASNVVRNGKSLGKFTAGIVSGLTSLQKIE